VRANGAIIGCSLKLKGVCINPSHYDFGGLIIFLVTYLTMQKAGIFIQW
jgi:hypothetical protein